MYVSHFGFRERPFNITPDPRFFYSNAVYREAYATVLYGVRQRKGFVVLTGEVGTGKTTVLRRLMSHVEPDVTCVLFCTTMLDFDGLLGAVCEELRLRVDGIGALPRLRALNERLRAEVREGRTVALLIDEAQNLADETLESLRLLSNLETAHDKLLQIVLVGQPELDAILDRPHLRQLKQRVAVRSRLDRLRASEVSAFIAYRLAAAGYEGRPLFSAESIALITAASAGLPRVINTICDNALLATYGAGERRVSADTVRDVLTDLCLPLDSARPAPAAPPADARPSPRAPVRRASRWPWIGVGAVAACATGVVALGVPRPIAERTVAAVAESISGDPLAPAAAANASAPLAPVPVVAVADTPAAAVVNPAEPPATPPAPPVRSIARSRRADWRAHPMVVPAGATIGGLVAEHYRDRRLLAIDLIKEFNPHLDNLNHVRAGERLWLPPLSSETLARRQADGTWRLVVDAYATAGSAGAVAQEAAREGYTTAVSRRDVTDDIVLYRVQLMGLRDLDMVERAARAARDRWASIVDAVGAVE